MAYTYAQLAEKTQEAIVSVLENGQAVSWNGQTYTKADLGKLMELERKYQSLAESQSMANSQTRYSGRVRYNG